MLPSPLRWHFEGSDGRSLPRPSSYPRRSSLSSMQWRRGQGRGGPFEVAAGILPAVEGGSLPPGPAFEPSSTITTRTSIPPGETPSSTAGKMPAATVQGAGSLEMRPLLTTKRVPNCLSWRYIEKRQPSAAFISSIIGRKQWLALDGFGLPVSLADVMGNSCKSGDRNLGAGRPAAWECRARRAASETSSLCHRCRRGNFQHSTTKRSGWLSLSLHQ